MKYLTGVYALNVDDPSGTPGDWHWSALDWSNPPMAESEKSPFGDWGIHTQNVKGVGRVNVASHLRACLDLVVMGAYGAAQGMRDSFLSDERLTPTVFEKVSSLRGAPDWFGIDRFMGKEYGCKWLDYKLEVGIDG